MGPIAAPASAAPASSTSSIKLASSFSGLSATGGDALGKISPVTSPDGKTQSLDKIGSAVGQAASGQVSSALGVLGVGDSPGWLKGLSTLAGGLKIGGTSNAAPIAASAVSSAASGALGGVHGSSAGQAPGPVTNFNIQTTDLEPAYLVSERIAKERAAANLAAF